MGRHIGLFSGRFDVWLAGCWFFSLDLCRLFFWFLAWSRVAVFVPTLAFKRKGRHRDFFGDAGFAAGRAFSDGFVGEFLQLGEFVATFLAVIFVQGHVTSSLKQRSKIVLIDDLSR